MAPHRPRDRELLLDLPVVVEGNLGRRPQRLKRRRPGDLQLDDLRPLEGDAVEARPEKRILGVRAGTRFDEESGPGLEGLPGGGLELEPAAHGVGPRDELRGRDDRCAARVTST